MSDVLHYKAGEYLPVTENWVHEQIRFLRRFRPVVYCHGKINTDLYPLETIRSFPRIEPVKGLKSVLSQTLNRAVFYIVSILFLISDKPKLIHAHFGPSGYLFLPIKKISRLPMVTTFYGYDMSMVPQSSTEWRNRYRKLFMEGEAFFVEGSHMKESLANLGCPSDKIFIRRLGIDVDAIKYKTRRISRGEEVRVLVAGSFREKKGIPYAVEAVGRLKMANPGLMIRLTIIGDAADRPSEVSEKKKILDKISEYRLGDHVSLLGYRPHSFFLEELYRNHIFLAPSVTASDGDAEGGAPVSIIEALASGIPVISTYHCDIPEVVIDNECGLLVNERDPAAIKDKIEALISDPGFAEKLSLSGRSHIERDYNAKTESEKAEAIYASLLTR